MIGNNRIYVCKHKKKRSEKSERFLNIFNF